MKCKPSVKIYIYKTHIGIFKLQNFDFETGLFFVLKSAMKIVLIHQFVIDFFIYLVKELKLNILRNISYSYQIQNDQGGIFKSDTLAGMRVVENPQKCRKTEKLKRF